MIERLNLAQSGRDCSVSQHRHPDQCRSDGSAEAHRKKTTRQKKTKARSQAWQDEGIRFVATPAPNTGAVCMDTAQQKIL